MRISDWSSDVCSSDLEDDLEQRGADHHRGRHAEQVDHRGHYDEATADAHDGGQHADQKADHDGQQRRDVELGLAEAHLQRKAVQPVVLVQLAPDVGLVAAEIGIAYVGTSVTIEHLVCRLLLVTQHILTYLIYEHTNK